jgi:hypothetical protein
MHARERDVNALRSQPGHRVAEQHVGARIRVAEPVRHQPRGDDTLRIHPEIDGGETAERSHEHARAREQHQRHGHLHDDERQAQPMPSGTRAAALLHDGAKIRAR